MLVEGFFDRFTDGVVISDGRGDILYLNPAAKKLLGAELPSDGKLNACETVCGRLFADGIQSCAQTCALRKPGPHETHVDLRGKRGPLAVFEWKDLSIHKVEHWQSLKVHCLEIPGLPLDLADEVRHFTLIEEASAEEELALRKEDWRSMVAHDLRSPLTGIMTTLKLIKEVPPDRPLSAKEAQLLDIAARSGQKIADLLDLFLDVAQLDSGKMPVNPERLAMRPMALRAAEGFAAQASAKKLTLKVEVGEEASALVDAPLFGRVLDNLLGNAVKFTPEGGTIRVFSGGAPRAPTLTVKDTGPGISAEEVPLIFDRYHQAKARRKGLIEGNGLGLTFCLEALKAMGGGIGVRSTPGEGAEFVVSLPRG